MIYTEGKIIIRINGSVLIVDAISPEEDILEWEEEMGYRRQWIKFNNNPYKYHIHPYQVIGKHSPLKPFNYLKRKIKL